MPLESTEYYIHTLKLALDNLRDRMRREAKRDAPESHYHYVVTYKCTRDYCAGVDSVISTYNLLQDELGSIEQEFPGHILSVKHIP